MSDSVIRDLGFMDKEAGVDEYYDVLIITALDLENKAVVEHLKRLNAKLDEKGSQRRKGTTRWVLPKSESRGHLDLRLRCLRYAGNGYAGIDLLNLILSVQRPRLVVFCGIAGSLDVNNAQLGNVIVSRSVHWRGFDKIEGDELAMEMRKKNLTDYRTNPEILTLLEEYIEKGTPSAEVRYKTDGDFSKKAEQWLIEKKASFGSDLDQFDPLDYVKTTKPIARIGKLMSWDFVLNKRDLRDKVKLDDRDYYAVEMESGGLAHAIEKATAPTESPKIDFFSVRGISDLSCNKSDDFFRDLAADHAAAFTVGFLHAEYIE